MLLPMRHSGRDPAEQRVILWLVLTDVLYLCSPYFDFFSRKKTPIQKPLSFTL